MRYTIARFEEYEREMAYRIFVTKSLQLIPQSKWLNTDYENIIKPQKIDKRSGEEVALDVIKKAGLRFG